MLKPALLAAMIAALAACSAPGPKLDVHDGWARETGQSDIAAAYVTIDNKGGADELNGVRATDYQNDLITRCFPCLDNSTLNSIRYKREA